jgi:hypothetical protein
MSVLIDTRLAYLRYTTKMYIYGDPTSVIIQRQTKVNKPGGGHDFPKMPLPAQTFRFVNQDIGSGIDYGSDDGIARRFSYVIIGEYDADLDVNDTWTVGEQQYKIDSIAPDNGWERRANVTCFAIEPEHG